MFAHEVKFGLSKGNDSHATMIGSIFSLFIKGLMLFYIHNLFLKGWNHSADSNDSIADYVDLESKLPVKATEMDFLNFY